MKTYTNPIPLIEDPDKALATFIYDYLIKKNHVSAAAAFIVEAQIAAKEVAEGGVIFLQDWFEPFWVMYLDSRTQTDNKDVRVRKLVDDILSNEPSIEKLKANKVKDEFPNGGSDLTHQQAPSKQQNGRPDQQIIKDEQGYTIPQNPPPGATPKNGNTNKTPRNPQGSATPSTQNNVGTPARPQTISIPPNNFPIQAWPGNGPNGPGANQNGPLHPNQNPMGTPGQNMPNNLQVMQGTPQVMQPNQGNPQMMQPNQGNPQMMQPNQVNPALLANMSRPNTMMANNPALMRNLQGQMHAFQQQQFVAQQNFQRQIGINSNGQLMVNPRMMRPYAQGNQNMQTRNNMQIQQAAFVEHHKQAQAMKAQNSQNTPGQGPNSASAPIDPNQMSSLQQMQQMNALMQQNMMHQAMQQQGMSQQQVMQHQQMNQAMQQHMGPNGMQNPMQQGNMAFNPNQSQAPNQGSNQASNQTQAKVSATPQVQMQSQSGDTNKIVDLDSNSINFESMFMELNTNTPNGGNQGNTTSIHATPQQIQPRTSDKKASPPTSNGSKVDKVSFESYINDGDYTFNFDNALSGLEAHTSPPKTSGISAASGLNEDDLTGSLESIMGMDPFGHSEYFS